MPLFNPSPKTRFRQVADNISEHRKMLELPAFDRAIDFALMQYQSELAMRCNDPNSAVRMGLSLLGAQEFVTILRTLSEQIELKPTVVNDNLNQRA